eukprot:4812508-Prymnesium_polylepis.2
MTPAPADSTRPRLAPCEVYCGAGFWASVRFLRARARGPLSVLVCLLSACRRSGPVCLRASFCCLLFECILLWLTRHALVCTPVATPPIAAVSAKCDAVRSATWACP